MCKVLGLSSSSYYYWLKHPVSLTKLKSQELLVHIYRAYENSKCRYGIPRITIELKQSGICTSQIRVARAMKKVNPRSIVRRKYRIQTTDSRNNYAVVGNHLQQDFTVARLAQKWVSDLTYIKTDEGWLYLTNVIDLAD